MNRRLFSYLIVIGFGVWLIFSELVLYGRTEFLWLSIGVLSILLALVHMALVRKYEKQEETPPE